MSGPGDLAGRHKANVFFTWTAQRDAAPMEIVSGSGAHFQTADGADWLDFGSMVWNASLGHGHPGMKRALVAAAERGLVPLPSSVFPDKARAAELLLEVAPAGLRGGKAFLCLSGAEANENAVKMARLVTGRRKIVYRSRSYHGATLAMLSLSGDPRRVPFDPGLPDGVAWNDPYSTEAGAGDLERVLAREDPRTVAAVLLEGVVGANGVYPPPTGYWKRVREVCDRHGVLLIADEVLSGFGRTGRWFAVDHDDVSPDLLTCAKGLTAGYAPGGATLASAKVARHFDEHVLSCGLTAYAHPLTCAAIVAAIEAYQREDLVARAERLGGTLEVLLRTLAETRPFVREVRGLGLLWAVELDAGPAELKRLAQELRARRLHLHKRDNMVFVAPPLVIEESDLKDGVATLAAALDAAWAHAMTSKVRAGAAEALAGLRDGMRLMAGGFGLSGNAEHCIDEIVRRGVKDLTIISNNCGNQGQGLAVLLKQRQIKKVVCSFIGGNPDLAEQYAAGTVEVELTPQGTLAERIRAGGAGIGGFYTPTGVGTVVAEGKEVRELDGQTYLLEKPLRADYAIVRAAVGDPDGNLRFYRTARSFNPVVAMAAEVTVAEVDRLVGRGELDPDDIHLPGIFVHHIFEARTHRNPIEFRTTRKRP